MGENALSEFDSQPADCFCPCTTAPESCQKGGFLGFGDVPVCERAPAGTASLQNSRELSKEAAKKEYHDGLPGIIIRPIPMVSQQVSLVSGHTLDSYLLRYVTRDNPYTVPAAVDSTYDRMTP